PVSLFPRNFPDTDPSPSLPVALPLTVPSEFCVRSNAPLKSALSSHFCVQVHRPVIEATAEGCDAGLSPRGDRSSPPEEDLSVLPKVPPTLPACGTAGRSAASHRAQQQASAIVWRPNVPIVPVLWARIAGSAPETKLCSTGSDRSRDLI